MIGMGNRGCLVGARPRARAVASGGGLQLASTTLTSAALPSPYFLEVKLTVSKSAVASYRDLAPPAVAAIQKKTPLRLAVAAQSLSGTEFFHLWTMPEADSLRNSMMEMVDDVPLASLQANEDDDENGA